MGRRESARTQRSADYAPSRQEAELIDAAFGRATNLNADLLTP